MILTFSFSHNCAFVYLLRNVFKIICLFGLGLFSISFRLQPANSKKLKSAIVHCIFLKLPFSPSLPPSAPPSLAFTPSLPLLYLCTEVCIHMLCIWWLKVHGGWVTFSIDLHFVFRDCFIELMIQFSWMEGISYPRDSSVAFFLALELQVHTPTPALLFM